MDERVSGSRRQSAASELLRTVKKGGTVVVTSHGKPIVKITPVDEDEPAVKQARARPKSQARASASAGNRVELVRRLSHSRHFSRVLIDATDLASSWPFHLGLSCGCRFGRS
jgi:prevent-host-death family protein